MADHHPARRRPAGLAERAALGHGPALGRRRRAGRRRGRGAGAMGAGRRGGRLAGRAKVALDRPARRQLLPGPRRPEPAAGDADHISGAGGRAGLVERDPRAGRVLLLQPALDAGRDHRRVHRPRPLPVLLLLGADAGAHVFPDRDLGARAAHLRGHEVLHLHPGQRPADAAGDPGALLRPRPRQRRLHLRLHQAARDGAGRAGGDPDHVGLPDRLPGEAAGAAAA